MTNEEEKILEEENDITLEDAAEEAEELQEETQDEAKEVREEIPEGIRLDPDEIRERPVLRERLRDGGGNPEMIQKHIDNFLAGIAGDTPVDTNVRTSAEFWLKKIMDKFANGDGLGNVVRIKKVWENPDPTQSFTAQTLTIDLSEFNFVLISCRFGNTAVSALQPPAFIPVGQSGACVGIGSTEYCYRVFTVSGTGIDVQNAAKISHGASTPSEGGNAIVPMYIYGIKLI